MNRMSRASIAALLCTSLAGCASFDRLFEPRIVHGTSLLPAAERIAVYETSPPGTRQYSFIRRLWVESWRSAIDVPHYASVEAGMADLRNQAVALGGDAIMNFGCYNITSDSPAAWNSLWTKIRTIPREMAALPAAAPKSPPSLICNGTVIKYDA